MEVLKLYIHVNGCEKVESECATVQMISFDGRCDGDYFRGEILPGGVDTQIYYKDQPSKLSARYLVQGIDHTGRGCRIFIENNGIMYDGETITRPVIDGFLPRNVFPQEILDRDTYRIPQRETGIFVQSDTLQMRTVFKLWFRLPRTLHY